MKYIHLTKRLFIFGIPLDIFSILNIGGKGITLSIVSILMMTFILFVNFRFTKNTILGMILFIIFWFYYSIFLPTIIMGSEQYLQKSLFASIYSILFAIVVIFFSKYGSFTEDIKFFLKISLIIAIFGVYQFVARNYDLPFNYLPITNASYHNPTESITGFNFERNIQPPYWNASSTFLEPSYFGRYLVFSIFFYFFLIDNKIKISKLYLYVFFLALTFSFSLGAFVLVTVSFIMYLFYSKKMNLKYIVFFIVFIVVILSIDNFQTRVVSLLLNFTNPTEVAGSYAIRIQGTLQALDAFYQYPIMGSGFSVYKLITDTAGTDSQFFEILYQFGILGLVLYLIILVYFYRKRKENKIFIFLIFIYMIPFNGLWDLLYALIFGLMIKSQKRVVNETN